MPLLRNGGLSRRLAPQEIPYYHYVEEDPDDKKDRAVLPIQIIPRIVFLSTTFGITRLSVLLQRVRWSTKLWSLSLLVVVALVAFDFMRNINLEPSDFRKRPIMVHMSNDTTVVKQLPLQAQHWIQDRRNHCWLDHGTSNHRQISELNPDCTPLGAWQEERNILNCNSFHEISLAEDIAFVGKGGFMVVWAFHEYDGTPRALKMLRYSEDSDFNHINYEDHRKEALASEQLSASPYVANLYGFCSHSSVTPFADRVLREIFESNTTKPTKEDLFRIAHDVACGVRDFHHFNNAGLATMAHMDVKANQFLLIDGIYQLNDFNLCEFLTWNKSANEYCWFGNGYTGRWQSPEQSDERYLHQSEKSDIFSLGYVLYFLLTGIRPFNDADGEEVQDLVLQGKRPPISSEIQNSTHPFDIALRTIVIKCLDLNPASRPSSREVADYLRDALLKAGLTPTPTNLQIFV